MINIIEGDLLKAKEDIICHQVNCQGVMGSGIAGQIKNQFPEVYEEYKKYCNTNNKNNLLGETLLVNTNNKIFANIFGQFNYGYDGALYTNYDALRTALDNLHYITTNPNGLYYGCSIALPYKMGCDRGGGDWNMVYKMIEDIFIDKDVTIYKYNGGK